MKRTKAQLNAISRAYAAKALKELETHECAKLFKFSTYKTLRGFVTRYERDAKYAAKVEQAALMSAEEYARRSNLTKETSEAYDVLVNVYGIYERRSWFFKA